MPNFQNVIAIIFHIRSALRDLVPCAQFEKRENSYGGVLLLVKL